MDTTIQLDGQVFLSGLRWAVDFTQGPLFCILKGRMLKLAYLGSSRMAVSWQALRPSADRGDGFFLIPPPIVRKLSSIPPNPLIAQVGSKHVSITTGWEAEIRVEWEFDPQDLAAPPQFGQMIVPTKSLLQVNYVTLADVVHRAVAKLGEKDANESVARTKLAILLNLQPSRLIVDGVEISRSEPEQFYFDPRLIVRSLDLLEGRQIGLGIQRLGLQNRAILHLVSTGIDSTVSCGLLSISLDTQKLYPLPPRHS